MCAATAVEGGHLLCLPHACRSLTTHFDHALLLLLPCVCPESLVQILPPVKARLESMLQVVPVSGNLFAKRDCKARVLPSGNCAEFADPTRCGSRTDTHFTAIPEAWFAEEKVRGGGHPATLQVVGF